MPPSFLSDHYRTNIKLVLLYQENKIAAFFWLLHCQKAVPLAIKVASRLAAATSLAETMSRQHRRPSSHPDTGTNASVMLLGRSLRNGIAQRPPSQPQWSCYCWPSWFGRSLGHRDVKTLRIPTYFCCRWHEKTPTTCCLATLSPHVAHHHPWTISELFSDTTINLLAESLRSYILVIATWHNNITIITRRKKMAQNWERFWKLICLQIKIQKTFEIHKSCM